LVPLREAQLNKVENMATDAKIARFKKDIALLDLHKRDPAKSKLLPRDRIRIRMRCRLCGRPRAVYRKFGLCRICFRDMASDGLIPGVVKASW
jgi:small subunit ribosomal protein S14